MLRLVQNGWTSLHDAAYVGGEEVVVLLLKEGAHPRAKNKVRKGGFDSN